MQEFFYQDPATVNTTTFEISSEKAGKLLGTIYLPNGIFKVHASNPIGKVGLYGHRCPQARYWQGAELFINADYASTSVPVPEGVSVRW